jgi:hypothetical protein
VGALLVPAGSSPERADSIQFCPTIVGETTGGGAHPVPGHAVADYFMVGVPFAKALDPVTKTNWEGTGWNRM